MNVRVVTAVLAAGLAMTPAARPVILAQTKPAPAAETVVAEPPAAAEAARVEASSVPPAPAAVASAAGEVRFTLTDGAAILATALSFLALSGYDASGLRYIGVKIKRVDVGVAKAFNRSELETEGGEPFQLTFRVAF